MRHLQDQFNQKMQVLEQEIRNVMDNRGKQHNQQLQEEGSRLRQQFEAKITKAVSDLQEKESQLEKQRAQNAEITRELVEATNESGQAKNEARILRDKLKKAQIDIQRLEETLAQKEQQLGEIKNEQFQMLHKNKGDFLRVQEQLRGEIQAINKEKDGLEQQLKDSLMRNDQLLETNHNERIKLTQQMNSYRDENESLKKQMFMLDKQKLQHEEKLLDELDSL